MYRSTHTVHIYVLQYTDAVLFLPLYQCGEFLERGKRAYTPATLSSNNGCPPVETLSLAQLISSSR